VARREHPSKVVRLVEGQLVGYPAAEHEDCTLWVALPDAPDEWEGLLGRRLTGVSAEVVAIPAFAYDVNLGDVVRVLESAEGAPVVCGIVAESGNYTFRALFESAPHTGSQHWQRLMADLEPHGCWFDGWSETLIAISVGAAHAQAVADYLARRQTAGELRYETGRSG